MSHSNVQSNNATTNCHIYLHGNSINEYRENCFVHLKNTIRSPVLRGWWK